MLEELKIKRELVKPGQRVIDALKEKGLINPSEPRGAKMAAQQRRWGRGFRAGPWPGAGPFSHLPPWQRPGWLYGRSAPPFQGFPYEQQQAPPRPQWGMPMYRYARPIQPVGYPTPLVRAPPTHADCAYFNGGTCTPRGISVPANGAACPSFAPKAPGGSPTWP